MNYNILIIEDEPGIADNITYALTKEGFKTTWVSTGIEGLEELKNKDDFHLIILDIGLPDINGFELIKVIRKESDIPVIFLTARSEEIDRVIGLELGGDDYVVKPFSPRELSARVRAILRRCKKDDNSTEDGPSTFCVDANKCEITYFGRALALSRYEYQILSLLIKRPGWIFSRDKIMDMIWEEPEESFDRTVDTHIKTIRAKLKEINPDCDPIKTHRGMGYSLKEES